MINNLVTKCYGNEPSVKYIPHIYALIKHGNITCQITFSKTFAKQFCMYYI